MNLIDRPRRAELHPHDGSARERARADEPRNEKRHMTQTKALVPAERIANAILIVHAGRR
jgi:hypothetical protein